MSGSGIESVLFELTWVSFLVLQYRLRHPWGSQPTATGVGASDEASDLDKMRAELYRYRAWLNPRGMWGLEKLVIKDIDRNISAVNQLIMMGARTGGMQMGFGGGFSIGNEHREAGFGFGVSGKRVNRMVKGGIEYAKSDKTPPDEVQ